MNELAVHLRDDFAALQRAQLQELVFDQRGLAITAVLIVGGLAVAVLIWRLAKLRHARGNGVTLPTILTLPPTPVRVILRHVPTVLIAGGLPLFMVALAEPYSSITEKQVSYPGRRIAILVDGSSSMTAPFNSTRLTAPNAPNNVFTTTIEATEIFIRRRMEGQYQDLIALIEFGNQAYVITPFTTDYENVLLSVSLIGQWEEYERFPDLGTTIGTGIQQAIRLFEAFSFREAAGNAMVIFSDGQDTEVSLGGKTVRQVMAEAAAAQIPVYFIRCGLNRQLGDIVPDALWKPAAEFTGGRFYAAATEQDVLAAISDIDRRSGGTVSVKQYAVRQAEFAPFALAAGVLWLLGVLAKLTIPYFSTFP